VSGIKWVALFATVFCFGRISLRSCPSLCTIGHQMARTAVLAEQHCIPHVTLWRWDPIGCPETSVNNSQSAQLNIPEERGPLRHSLPQYEWRMASCWRLCGLMRQNSNDADKRRARVEGKGIQCRSVCQVLDFMLWLQHVGHHCEAVTLYAAGFLLLPTPNNSNRAASCEINVPFLTCCDLPT